MASEDLARFASTVNRMHPLMITSLESTDCSGFQVISYCHDVIALYYEKPILPYLTHFDELIAALQTRFRTPLAELLKTVDGDDKGNLIDCVESIELIAKERKLAGMPCLDDESGKAATLGFSRKKRVDDTEECDGETLRTPAKLRRCDSVVEAVKAAESKAGSDKELDQSNYGKLLHYKDDGAKTSTDKLLQNDVGVSRVY